MKLSPVISVVIPVFNVKQYLPACIASLLAQTLEETEFIFADDCSNDGSADVIREAGRKDGRIKYVCARRNQGAFAARKIGVAAASAPFVTFADPDDTLPPDACRLLAEKLSESGADIVHGFTEIVNSNGLPEERLEFVRKTVQPVFPSLEGRDILSELAVTAKINPTLWGKAYKTELVKRALDLVPDGEYRRANDLLANFAICCLAEKYASFDATVYNYCYGQGVFGAAEQDLPHYESICRQVDIVPAMREIAEKHFAGDAAVSAAFKAVESRLVGGCYSRIAATLERPEDRRAAFSFLLGRVGGLRLATVLAQKNYARKEDFAAELAALDAIPRIPPKRIGKIGFFYYHLTPGGVQRVIADQVSVFMSLGRKVVIFLEKEITDECFDLPLGVEIVYLPPVAASNRDRIGERLAALSAALEEHDIDMMYCHAYLGPNFLWDLLVCKWVRRIPVLTHYHTAVCFVPRVAASYTRWPGFMKMLSFSDGVIALSRSDALMLRCCGVRAKYMPNPVPSAAVARKRAVSRDGRTILWMARFSHEKNPSDSVKILAKVRAKIPDARLTIVGGGPEKFVKEVETTIEQLGFGDAVTLAGEHKDVREYYENAALYLHTSNLDGFPMSILEAAASGLPVVMYSLPWLEIARDNDGIIQTPQSNLDKAAAAIISVFSSPEKAAAMAKANLGKCAAYATFNFKAEWRKILSNFEKGRPFVSGGLQPPKDDLEAFAAEFMHCYNRGIAEVQSAGAALEREKQRLSAKVALLEADNRKLKEAVAKAKADLGESQKRRGIIWADRQDIKRKFDALSKQSENTKRVVRKLKDMSSSLRRERYALGTSEAYRVGMLVTWPARKTWGCVKCLRENGLKYTVKHAAGKVLRLFGARH